MRIKFAFFLAFTLLFPNLCISAEPVFYETVPLIGKIIMLVVAFSVPGILIFSHIGLFEFLETDKFPEPPPISREQKELLTGTVVGLVFGILLTAVFIILS